MDTTTVLCEMEVNICQSNVMVWCKRCELM